MALEALSASELLNFIMYNDPSNINNIIDTNNTSPLIGCSNILSDSLQTISPPPEKVAAGGSSAVGPSPDETAAAQGGRRKRRRRAKVCKNKEEAENQRMTHIAVERNRRKQMNEHLAVLRSLMPESYVQRGDQASIVGGAIEFVKELEHMLQSLEAKKYSLIKNDHPKNQHQDNLGGSDYHYETEDDSKENLVVENPFSQFFSYPQFSCNNSSNGNNNNNNQHLGSKYTSQSKAAIADIEVTLIETHANIRIMSQRRVRQLSKMVASFQSVLLNILHLNVVTTFDSRVLYSISAKVEEGCQLSSADDIATTVHHMLRIIEEETNILCTSQS